MKKFSILLALVFILASCGKAIEEKATEQVAAPIEKITKAVDENIVAEAKDAMLGESEVMVKQELMEKKEEVMVEDEIAMVKENGAYQDYSEEAVKAAVGTKVLFFHATWCGTCVKSDESLKSNSLPEGLNVFKVDYDSSTELKQKYGVTTKHTFVHIDDNMEKIELVVGLSDAADIEKAFMLDETAMVKKEVMVKEEAVAEAPVVLAGSYQDYSESAVKAASGSKVLYFSASWCPSCVAAEKNLQAETIPEGLHIFKLDFDSSLELRKKYGVTTKHTFVLIDDNMEKVKLMVTGMNSADVVNGLLK